MATNYAQMSWSNEGLKNSIISSDYEILQQRWRTHVFEYLMYTQEIDYELKNDIKWIVEKLEVKK